MTLKKVSFGTTKIQKLRRVALDENLLDTLGLGIGDFVRVELDTENETIMITPLQQSRADQNNSASTPRRARVKS